MSDGKGPIELAGLLHEQARRRARGSLIAFAQFVNPDYRPAWFHRLIAEKLEAVERGEIRRLIICMPPQHGKSMLATVYFPAWYLGRNPKKRIACCSYSAPLAIKHSRESRDIFTTRAFREVFPEARHQPSRAGQRRVEVALQAASEWGTSHGGTVRAVGVGGSLTGHTTQLGIIDDPHKDRKEADSTTVRQAVHDWYTSTFLTRLTWSQGPIVLIQTRWHPDDLAGRLLREEAEGGEKWEKVILPALDENDRALWPSDIPAKFLIALRESYRIKGAEHDWASLYMQQDVMRGGNLFDVDKIDFVDPSQVPENLHQVRCWDLASSVKERTSDDPDFTVGVRGGGIITDTPFRVKGEIWETQVADIWVTDVKFCREEKPKRDQMILRATKEDGPSVTVHIEAFGGYKDAYTDLKNVLDGIRSVVRAKPKGDKMQKAGPLENIISSGRLHIVRAPWNSFLEKQLLEFPAGHDDAVDALAILYWVTVGNLIRPGISSGVTPISNDEEPEKIDEPEKRPQNLLVNDPAVWD